ncbi:hypothetical protein HAX54_024470 [Datura stramonium]|uniref:Pentatricopeptide repeat-containing protein n=1 Tax=Datura stramonium TaxID=4076 RepID=A0ABS8UYU3_DATST|nr:hypothetical protein [Datura stramonium]
MLGRRRRQRHHLFLAVAISSPGSLQDRKQLLFKVTRNAKSIQHATPIHAHIIKNSDPNDPFILFQSFFAFCSDAAPLNMLPRSSANSDPNKAVNRPLPGNEIAGLRSDRFVRLKLMELYGKLSKAMDEFHLVSTKDNVCWTAMIDGLVRNGEMNFALELFREMQMAGVKPNEVTIVCVLSACAQLEH